MSFLGNIFGFSAAPPSRAQEHYEDVYLQSQQPKHESSLTHEGIAAAAGFAAMHAYEAHLRATGQPVSHGKMKEFLAAIAAAEVDKLAETKGLDWLDRKKAKSMAQHQAHTLAEQRYSGGDRTGWEYARQSSGPAREYDYNGGGAPFGAQGCPTYGQWGPSAGGYGGGYCATSGGGVGYGGQGQQAAQGYGGGRAQEYYGRG